MEFEEMQILWNSQNNEKLYAINEDALYAQIKRKGQSIDRKLSRASRWRRCGRVENSCCRQGPKRTLISYLKRKCRAPG